MRAPGIDALEAMLERAAASGAYDELRRALSLEWAGLAPQWGSELRAIFDAMPAEEWQDDPWLVTGYGATYRSLETPSRSAALPYLAAASKLVTAETLPAIDAGRRVHVAATLRSLGRFDEALEAVDAGLAGVAMDATMPLAWRIPIEAKLALQAGIAHFHLGDYDSAMSELRLASGLAGVNLHTWERVECFGALAMLEYTRGNFDAAIDFAGQARDAAADTGLLESPFGAGALIAELLIAVERDDLPLAERLAPIVAVAAPRSDWEPLGLYARAAPSIISQLYVEGLELLRECVQAYREWRPRGTIVTVSDGLRGTLLLRVGATEAAWDILAALQPTQHHANCPGRMLAHLRLITGDPSGALAALRDCEALGDTHSTRTLVDVLLIKAAANYELGTGERGDVAFDRALRLAARNRMLVPFLLVPAPIVQAMVEAASRRSHPAAVAAMLEQVRGTATPLGGAIRLSSRERDIVRSLAGGRTAGEIADDLFISVNTVKSHLKSAYRKLDVTTRSEAMKRARELGLHVEITPD